MKPEPIDIKGGDLTFGQRIELGKIFQGNDCDSVKFERVFQCLHGFTPKTEEYAGLIDYFNDITEGLRFWIEQETNLLKHEPSAEEISAGVREFSEKVGEFGTIKALAKAYSQDPDTVLTWKYGKVFGILYTDLEEFKYQQRFNKVIEKKYRSKK